MHVLQVLDQAFRTNVEEQDETILWLIQSMITHSMFKPENKIDLLLSGHAVYYAFQQDVQPALAIADWTQTQPADISRDINNLLDSGVEIMVVFEDLVERGLEQIALPDQIKLIKGKDLTKIYDRVDQVWHW